MEAKMTAQPRWTASVTSDVDDLDTMEAALDALDDAVLLGGPGHAEATLIFDISAPTISDAYARVSEVLAKHAVALSGDWSRVSILRARRDDE